MKASFSLVLIFEMFGGTGSSSLTQQPARDAQQERNLSALRKSNEYARAFAFAIRNGFTPNTGRGVDDREPQEPGGRFSGPSTNPGEEKQLLLYSAAGSFPILNVRI